MRRKLIAVTSAAILALTATALPGLSSRIADPGASSSMTRRLLAADKNQICSGAQHSSHSTMW